MTLGKKQFDTLLKLTYLINLMKNRINKVGRPPVEDKRVPLSFRIKGSLAEWARRLGRDKVEHLIQAEAQRQMDRAIRAEQLS